MAGEIWNTRRPWSLLAPLGVYALLLGWIAFSAARDEGYDFSFLLFGLANLIVFTDAIDFGVRMYVHRRHTAVPSDLSRGAVRQLSIDLPAAQRKGPGPAATRTLARPYAIIASVFNLGDELDEFMERLGPYRDRVWLISDGSTDNTAKRLVQAGWRCLDEEVNRHKPGAIQYLLSKLPPQIETVMVIDPDVKICSREEGSLVDLDRAVADLQHSGAAACCPRVAIEKDGILARFQALEYVLACVVGRRSLADFVITSGVSIYRRDALERALDQHSLSIYAEDLENSVVLLHAGERIYYDGRLLTLTHGPHTIRHWFSQRVGWYYGLIRVYTQHLPQLWHIARRTPFAMYNFVAYVGVLGLALHVLRIASAGLLFVSVLAIFDKLFVIDQLRSGTAINPVFFAGAFACYVVFGAIALLTVVPRRERAYIAPILPLYFIYVLAHLVPITVGFANWIALRWWGRRLYRDHYHTSSDDTTLTLPLRTNGNGLRANGLAPAVASYMRSPD